MKISSYMLGGAMLFLFMLIQIMTFHWDFLKIILNI